MVTLRKRSFGGSDEQGGLTMKDPLEDSPSTSDQADPKDQPQDRGLPVEYGVEMKDVLEQIVVEQDPKKDSVELFLEHYFRDHYTLSTPSSLVRFRSAHTAARVFENKSSQFILEEQIDPETLRRRISVKHLSDGTTGLQFLRMLYTIMCVFWTGTFFVLCLQVLLIMVLELAIQIGTTEISAGLNVFRLIGYVSSPIFHAFTWIRLPHTSPSASYWECLSFPMGLRWGLSLPGPLSKTLGLDTNW